MSTQYLYILRITVGVNSDIKEEQVKVAVSEDKNVFDFVEEHEYLGAIQHIAKWKVNKLIYDEYDTELDYFEYMMFSTEGYTKQGLKELREEVVSDIVELKEKLDSIYSKLDKKYKSIITNSNK